jgi:hypothetical protein
VRDARAAARFAIAMIDAEIAIANLATVTPSSAEGSGN